MVILLAQVVLFTYRGFYQQQLYQKHQMGCVSSYHSVLQGYKFRSPPRQPTGKRQRSRNGVTVPS